MEEKHTQVKDRPGLGSVSQNEPITTNQKKQWKTKRQAPITCPQVSLDSGEESTRERIVFDPDSGRIVRPSQDSSDRAVVSDMHREGSGGFFGGFCSLALVQTSFDYLLQNIVQYSTAKITELNKSYSPEPTWNARF